MSRYQTSKSSLFLLELMINLLLFSVLCCCGLTFFIKSNTLTQTTTSLHRAVSITSSIANICESDNGNFTLLLQKFEHATSDNHCLFIYYDSTFYPCEKKNAAFYLKIEKKDTFPSEANIHFYSIDRELIYSLPVCLHKPITLEAAKEVVQP